jgi:hypothetical protein
MLDKSKSRVDTCRDTPKESQVAASAKQVTETEVEYVARRIASDDKVRQRVEVSIRDSHKGRVLTRTEAIQRLKKRAS